MTQAESPGSTTEVAPSAEQLSTFQTSITLHYDAGSAVSEGHSRRYCVTSTNQKRARSNVTGKETLL